MEERGGHYTSEYTEDLTVVGRGRRKGWADSGTPYQIHYSDNQKVLRQTQHVFANCVRSESHDYFLPLTMTGFTDPRVLYGRSATTTDKNWHCLSVSENPEEEEEEGGKLEELPDCRCKSTPCN
jgi:hypothetical protein